MFLDNLKQIGGSLIIKNNDMDNFKNIIGNLELIGAGLFITDNKNISTFGDNSFLSSIK